MRRSFGRARRWISAAADADACARPALACRILAGIPIDGDAGDALSRCAWCARHCAPAHKARAQRHCNAATCITATLQHDSTATCIAATGITATCNARRANIVTLALVLKLQACPALRWRGGRVEVRPGTSARLLGMPSACVSAVVRARGVRTGVRPCVSQRPEHRAATCAAGCDFSGGQGALPARLLRHGARC